jgi:LuxR family maltose regulon positive regulatory protein
VLIETLTAREAQVLGLLADMCSTDEIASELFLSVNTVKTYVRGILRKLSVNRRVDAVRRGRELGLC